MISLRCFNFGDLPKRCMRSVEKAMANGRLRGGTDSNTARFIVAVEANKNKPATPKATKKTACEGCEDDKKEEEDRHRHERRCARKCRE
jgi:hypothetical protein